MFNDIRLTYYIYMMFILWVITQNYVNLENFYVPWDSINIKDKVYKYEQINDSNLQQNLISTHANWKHWLILSGGMSNILNIFN